MSQPLTANVNSIMTSTYFSPARLTCITAHGHDDSAAGNSNAFLIPGKLFTSYMYSNALGNAPQVGRVIADFINILINNFGYGPSNIRIVGIGLGGHIAAIDPSFHGWTHHPDRLNADDAAMVEVIHATAGITGYDFPLGDLDFYPNGGSQQLGCGADVSCSHTYAYAFYAESITRDVNGGNRFMGTACESYEEAVAQQCSVCASKGTPLVPGDNSHYVEGESRYIWMPDSEGTPVLVDLEEPVDEEVLRSRNGANNQYWLFTRQNPTSARVIVNGNANTIWSSTYLASRPLKVIVHGWNNDGNTQMNPLITSAFLAVQDANVIVVDWRALANSAYTTAANGVPNVGQHLGNFLVWLINTAGGNWNNVHLVGFSLGLDPAGPGWTSNGNALSSNAGQYVEAIHTDGRLLGIFNPVGNADFYPNGGMNPQPGCWISTCSHGRATELFASSVRSNHFVGRLCPNIWEAELSTCSGAAFNMGNGIISKRGNGIYGLLCSGSAIPIVPGDNSHYVEGESRYVWMPDGEGTPHLVDLQEPVDEGLLMSRNGANNQYWLYTRQNPSNAQVIINGNANTIWTSNYVASRPLKVIVHGWNSDGNSEINPLITSAFLAVQDCNVIVLDWRALANANYISAANGVPSVGQFLGNFLIWLINTAGGNWNNVHLVGFSLGAHVVGNAGRQASGRPVRVTGLDPAGPLWGGNSNALNSNAGTYVEAIHTDGGLLGIFDKIVDADFYPNGGRNPQPGCWISTCSHSRAYQLFASTVRTNHLVGRACSNTNQAENLQCSGAALNMGNSILTKRGAIPNVPGDNSHYVEGESRYIWMPDGEGTPHLVDLQEPVDEGLQNPSSPQVIVNGDANTIWSSNYDASRPLAVIAHGWNNDGTSEVNTLLTSSFLAVQDCNVIVLDWSTLASANYISAAYGVPSVGQFLGSFLVWLINTTGGNWNNVHLVGHSLGAHVVGNAGRAASGLAARVTGMDPAGPLWGGNSNALNSNDGQYVEAIHTDGGLLGIFDKIADADFYPNGGRNPQPGCWISTCSHSRAYQLFASTVVYNHLIGRACSDTDQAESLQCSGTTMNLGNGILTKSGNKLKNIQ
ncbi:Neutral lipase [Operophtera brumata]|uniref:Neutral lipase n=1 Tax=Operophtera brumata TaxID=104452 RepID=A0A0L7LGU1_OPEBR|nr:Neutral lipase [Operophtera brumata]